MLRDIELGRRRPRHLAPGRGPALALAAQQRGTLAWRAAAEQSEIRTAVRRQSAAPRPPAGRRDGRGGRPRGRPAGRPPPAPPHPRHPPPARRPRRRGRNLPERNLPERPLPGSPSPRVPRRGTSPTRAIPQVPPPPPSLGVRRGPLRGALGPSQVLPKRALLTKLPTVELSYYCLVWVGLLG